jgi:hypothetical protein
MILPMRSSENYDPEVVRFVFFSWTSDAGDLAAETSVLQDYPL